VSDPVGAERSLKARFRAAAAEQGLSIVSWGFDPDDTGDVGADLLDVLLTAAEDTLATPVAQLANLADFTRVTLGAEAAAAQAEADAVRSTLDRRLSQGGSILDPEEP
jgi:hypothetical protein